MAGNENNHAGQMLPTRVATTARTRDVPGIVQRLVSVFVPLYGRRYFPKEVWTLEKIAAFISQALAKVLTLPATKLMSTSKQKYSVYRDNDLIASDLLSLPSIMKFVREDARKEHSQGRPAFYMITGSLGFKRKGSHLRGRVVWEG